MIFIYHKYEFDIDYLQIIWMFNQPDNAMSSFLYFIIPLSIYRLASKIKNIVIEYAFCCFYFINVSLISCSLCFIYENLVLGCKHFILREVLGHKFLIIIYNLKGRSHTKFKKWLNLIKSLQRSESYRFFVINCYHTSSYLGWQRCFYLFFI